MKVSNQSIIAMVGIALMFMLAGIVEAKESQRERRDRQAYERTYESAKTSIYKDCVQDTKIRTRVSWKKDTAAANRCYNTRWNNWLIEQTLISEQRANDAFTNTLNRKY